MLISKGGRNLLHSLRLKGHAFRFGPLEIYGVRDQWGQTRLI